MKKRILLILGLITVITTSVIMSACVKKGEFSKKPAFAEVISITEKEENKETFSVGKGHVTMYFNIGKSIITVGQQGSIVRTQVNDKIHFNAIAQSYNVADTFTALISAAMSSIGGNDDSLAKVEPYLSRETFFSAQMGHDGKETYNAYFQYDEFANFPSLNKDSVTPDSIKATNKAITFNNMICVADSAIKNYTTKNKIDLDFDIKLNNYLMMSDIFQLKKNTNLATDTIGDSFNKGEKAFLYDMKLNTTAFYDYLLSFVDLFFDVSDKDLYADDYERFLALQPILKNCITLKNGNHKAKVDRTGKLSQSDVTLTASLKISKKQLEEVLTILNIDINDSQVKTMITVLFSLLTDSAFKANGVVEFMFDASITETFSYGGKTIVDFDPNLFKANTELVEGRKEYTVDLA